MVATKLTKDLVEEGVVPYMQHFKSIHIVHYKDRIDIGVLSPKQCRILATELSEAAEELLEGLEDESC